MRNVGRLTVKRIERLNDPGRYGDGGGLWLQVSKWQTKSWLFRFARGGVARQMGLGPLRDVTLDEAREEARNCRRMLRDEIDPIEHRNAKRLAARKAQADARAKNKTLAECFAAYIKGHRATWKNEKHVAQWETTLKNYAPKLGSMRVADIDKHHVYEELKDLWSTKTETAKRVRGRIETVLSWAAAHGYRDEKENNPARWSDTLKPMGLATPSKLRPVQHFKAMDWHDLPAFMAELRQREGISAKALEFTVLTAARTTQTTHATWAEIDAKEAVWTVPGSRMKSGTEHRVPLGSGATAIIQSARPEGCPEGKESPFIFIGAREGRPLSNMAMLELLRGMRPASGLTVHGFRSTFRDWAAECTSVPREIVEKALAHVVGDETERAYQRSDLLAKRRELMEVWEAFCLSGHADKSNVITLAKAG